MNECAFADGDFVFCSFKIAIGRVIQHKIQYTYSIHTVYIYSTAIPKGVFDRSSNSLLKVGWLSLSYHDGS